MSHTPGPWRAKGGAVKAVSHGVWFTVALVDKARFTPEGCAENARFIAHAANCHEGLLACLKETREVAAAMVRIIGRNNLMDELGDIEQAYAGFGKRADAAIAKAEGKP